MPTLGREFLQALTNPPINQGLFNLGSAIGGMPAQYKAQKQQKATQAANAGIMEQIYQQNPEELLKMARALNATGNPADSARAVELVKVAQQMSQTQKTKKAEQTLAEFATKAGTKLRDPNVREGFFKLATQSNLSVSEADKLYQMFLSQYAPVKEIQKAGNTKTVVDQAGNYYDKQVITYTDGSSEEKYFPYNESPPQPVGRTVPASGTSGGNVQQKRRDAIDKEGRDAARLELADRLAPGNALAEASAKEFGTLRVEAAKNIPGLRDSTKNIGKIIALLRSPDFATGGLTRQIARSFTKFLGSEPATVGEFETRAGEVVLAKLQSFVGAISEGERNFLIEQVGSYLSSGESNIGRLLPLLERAEELLNNSILIASSGSFESYLGKVLPAEEETTSALNYSVFPADKKQEIQTAIENGEITYETAVEYYKQ